MNAIVYERLRFWVLNRHIAYLGILLIGLAAFYKPVIQLAQLSFDHELYSHFMLIPAVAIFFLGLDRQRIFKQTRWCPGWGLLVMALGIACYLLALGVHTGLSQNDYLSLSMLGLVMWHHGGFMWAYGPAAYRQAAFPLFFLLFCVPIPTFVLDPVIRFLQVWSAHAVHLAFDLVGIPYLRNDMFFQLPGIAIEVAKECSGIRSSLALVITSLLAGHLFLRTPWRKFLLAMTIIPVTIFKNAIRITTLSLLAVHVDTSWLTDSWLHKGGGIVFFLIALLFFAPVLWLFVRSEHRSPANKP